MAGDAADTTTATGSCASEINMRIIRFPAPDLVPPALRIAVKERKIQVAMKDISTRQREIFLQVYRRFHFDGQ